MSGWRTLAARLPRRPGGCERHRAALLDLLDGRTEGRDVERALEHLARCPSCEQEIGEYALVIAGLRRLGNAARRSEPPESGWSRVVARLQLSPAPRWRAWRVPVAGLVAVPALLAVLVAGSLGGTREASVPGGSNVGSAAVSLAGPSDLSAGPQHDAALQRAYRIADPVTTAGSPTLSAEEAAVTAEMADAGSCVATSVPPRGPLPDGRVIFLAPRGQEALGGSTVTVAQTIVPE